MSAGLMSVRRTWCYWPKVCRVAVSDAFIPQWHAVAYPATRMHSSGAAASWAAFPPSRIDRILTAFSFLYAALTLYDCKLERRLLIVQEDCYGRNLWTLNDMQDQTFYRIYTLIRTFLVLTCLPHLTGKILCYFYLFIARLHAIVLPILPLFVGLMHFSYV